MFSPESKSVSTLQTATMPAPSSPMGLTQGTYFLRCNAVAHLISQSTSTSALAARRASPRPQTPPDFQHPHPVYRGGGYPASQFHGPSLSLTPPLTAEIVSPTVIAMRDYHLNLHHHHQDSIDTPANSEPGTPQLRFPDTPRAIAESSGAPRRHSVAIAPYSKGLEQQTSDMNLQAPEVSRRSSATPASASRDQDCDHSTSASATRASMNRERWMQRVFSDEGDTEHPHVPEQQIHNPLDPRYLGNIPFSYTTNKLREWGDVYLFNSATADAFIRAIAIPAPSPAPPMDVKKEDGKTPEPTKQLIKVKVVPHCKTRKPFFMQKAFPIRQPATSPSYRISKHPRYHLRHHREDQGAKAEVLRNAAIEAGRRPAVPMHIEYALYRTPLLAAVLLCEHVKKGDIVEIPLPFPEAWEDVVEWVYTGNAGADVSAKVRETVEYLGGRI